MKRILSIFLFFLYFGVSIHAKIFVLVSGVSNYGSEAINLTQTTKDAKAFKSVMENQTKDITLLTSSYANRANILEKLKAICNRAQKGDRIVFFFSGHGQPNAICTYDEVIYYSELIEILTHSEAKEKICFIDACYAGSLAKEKNNQSDDSEWTKAVKAKKDQVFFVSSRGDEYSYEHPWVGAGYFTKALLKGMRGKADYNENKQVTVLELFKYIHTDVTKRSKSKQHPQLIAPEELYDCVLARWE